GTELIMKCRPQGEIYTTAILLRTTRQFSATRDALPLDRLIRFLYRAEFDPDVRLHSFLA
ncbi:MAG TPA: hypothetical protein VN999_17765, partial [Thermoanaerobaculia bacterium]|nr:hypothetical protein [Thermoanaerobaculia bacterium]